MTQDRPIGTTAAERHASWLELFFDLVVVAAVAQLAHRMHDSPSLAAVGSFVLLYYAIWSVWTSFTLYANVAGERTRTRAMLVAMLGIAVLAAAIPATIPEVLHNEGDVDRSVVFAVAYFVCRMSAASTWQRTGTVLTSWPAAQAGMGMIPWLVSVWVPAPARYWLWVLGAALDITFSILASRRPEQMLARAEGDTRRRRSRYEKAVARRGEPPANRRKPRFESPKPAMLDLSHLGERLGLFVIIVLGEGVLQVVTAAGNPLVHWDRDLGLTALAGFVVLVGIWWLTLRYGVNGVPHFASEGPAPRVTLPGHFVATASITAIAAGFGAATAHAHDDLPGGMRWLLCGGLAVHFAATGVLALINKAPLAWLLGWGLPCVAAPVAIGVWGASLDAWTIAVLLAAVVGWQTLYGVFGARRARLAVGD
ncbi:low temperature requirement protein A [Phytomonospora sp. NPDC050363]|uniref:low temperature requirement protein A n=1 Tax=Phytomonospora sp. NPDC050363 TaxID=3155642 RepID=UPI0033E188F9